MPLNFSDTVPAAPSGKANVKWQVDGDNNVSAYTDPPGGTTGPYDVVASYVGKPGAAALVLILTMVRAVSFAANFSGSRGTLSANPAAAATYTVKKNGSSIGTVAVSTGGVFTFATSGGAVQSFAIGDRMTVEAPSPADTTLADVGLTFAGTR